MPALFRIYITLKNLKKQNFHDFYNKWSCLHILTFIVEELKIENVLK
jgi:hypothetical protein